jgi:GTP-binding protein
MNIRNIAIIAHVDHGKTTLVDSMLKQSHAFRDNQKVAERAMDSNQLERERGITILAKTTAILYHDIKINILDTPGHADFGGEVERIMNMVDGVLLVVDAVEGTMPQTRFVLKRALEAGVKPIVVINKIDRTMARPVQVLDEVLELFIELGANESQLDFPVVYASGIQGRSSHLPMLLENDNMQPLFQMIIDNIPSPAQEIDKPLLFQSSLLDYNDYVGRMGIGRIIQGKMTMNSMVSCVRQDGSIKIFRIQKLFGYFGLDRIEIEEAYAGDVVAISGLPDIYVGETVCDIGFETELPKILVSEPTVEMTFGTNTSPFSGKEGKFVTSTKLDERLFRETERDVALRVRRTTAAEKWIVAGRGELHLGILIENMRREGYEFEVSEAKVITKIVGEQTLEPFESVQVDTPNEYVGSVIELLGTRGGALTSLNPGPTQTRLNYEMPSRGLIGFMTDFLTTTKGYGLINHLFLDYRPMENITIQKRKFGVLVAVESGVTTAYAIGGLEDRGTMFVEPRTNVYEGMIIGECNRDNDLAVNVVREKQMTNTRSSVKDSTVVLKRPRRMSLEMCLDYINEDELVEITPKSIRMRKRLLDTNDRKKYDSRKDR